MKGILAAQVQFTIQDWTHPFVSVQFTIQNWTRAIVAYLFRVRIPYASIVAVHFTIQNWTYQFFDSPIYNSELDPSNRDGPIFDSELDSLILCQSILQFRIGPILLGHIYLGYGFCIRHSHRSILRFRIGLTSFVSVHFTIQNWTESVVDSSFLLRNTFIAQRSDGLTFFDTQSDGIDDAEEDETVQ